MFFWYIAFQSVWKNRFFGRIDLMRFYITQSTSPFI